MSYGIPTTKEEKQTNKYPTFLNSKPELIKELDGITERENELTKKQIANHMKIVLLQEDIKEGKEIDQIVINILIKENIVMGNEIEKLKELEEIKELKFAEFYDEPIEADEKTFKEQELNVFDDGIDISKTKKAHMIDFDGTITPLED